MANGRFTIEEPDDTQGRFTIEEPEDNPDDSTWERIKTVAADAFLGNKDKDSVSFLGNAIAQNESGQVNLERAKNARERAAFRKKYGIDRALSALGLQEPGEEYAKTNEAIGLEKRKAFEKAAKARREKLARAGAPDSVGDYIIDYGTPFVVGAASPENFVGVGGAAKTASVAKKIGTAALGAAAGNAAVDPFLQKGSIDRGMREEYSPMQTAESAVIGGLTGGTLQGVGMGLSKLASKIRERRAVRQAEQIAKQETPEEYSAPKLRSDIPNEEWLNSKVKRAEEQGVNEHGAPFRGTVTGEFNKTVLVPIDVLANLKGVNGEQNNVRQEDLDWLKNKMGETKKLPIQEHNGEEYVPFINVAHDGSAWISEGNHRIMAAKELGWTHVPVEIRYFDGGELKEGPLSPSKVSQYDEQLHGTERTPELPTEVKDVLIKDAETNSAEYIQKGKPLSAEEKAKLEEDINIGAQAIKDRASAIGETPEELLNIKAPDDGLPKYADNGSLNLERLHTDEQTKSVLNALATKTERNPETHAMVTEQADAMMKKIPLLKLIDYNPNLEELSAYNLSIRTQTVLATEKLIAKAKMLADPTNPRAINDINEFQQLRLLAATLSARSEKVSLLNGRALQSLRIMAGQNNAEDVSKMLKRINHGNDLDVDSFAKLLAANAQNPNAVAKLAKDSLKPLWEDYLTSFHYSMMLSGLGTHAQNILGGFGMTVVDLWDNLAASAVGKARAMLPGQKLDLQQRMSLQEVNHRIRGISRALADAKTYKDSMQSWNEGVPIHRVSKVEVPHDMFTSKWTRPLTYPQRALAFADQLNRGIMESMEIQGLARRQALKEGKTGTDLEARTEELVQNPTKSMLESADRKAEELQFLEDHTFFGKAFEGLKTRTAKISGAQRVMRFAIQNFLPFLRVNENIVRGAIRRSPLNFLSGTSREMFKKGGIDRDIVVGRFVTGSLLAVTMWNLAGEGKITGDSPANIDEAKFQETVNGKEWNSITNPLTGNYSKLYGFDVLRPMMTTIANIRRAYDNGEISDKSAMDALLDVVGESVSSLGSAAYVDEFQKLTEMAARGTKGETARNNFIPSQIASWTVPNILREVNSSFVDDYQRDTTGDESIGERTLGAIEGGFPGLSDNLPIRADFLGRDITKQKEVVNDDTTIQELRRLGDNPNKGALLTIPKDTFKINGYKVELPAEAHQEYVKLAGQYTKQYLDGVMANPQWNNLDDDQKWEQIKRIQKASNKAARDQLFGQGGQSDDDYND